MEALTPENQVRNEYINTPEALADLCQRIQHAEWIALDTEFLRERTYYPKLCLVQLAIPGIIACIDVLVIDDLEPLLVILNKKSITKVFHACSQDLEILMQLGEQVPAPIFDTQIAAPLLGLPEQTGYAALVEAMLGIKLEKGHARTDWTARPLSKKQIQYAGDDVRYLCELYPILLEKLVSKRRLEWLDSDFKPYESRSRYENNPDMAWQRIRGHERLGQKQLSVLQALAKWREQLAQDENRPRGWLLRDDNLLDLARLQPDTLQEIAKIRQIPERSIAKYGETLIQLIKHAADMLPQKMAVKHRRDKPSLKQEALADALQAQLAVIAEKSAINPVSLATRKQLVALAIGERDLPIMNGWRLEMAGKELLAMIEGRRTISVQDNELVINSI